jgi:uncharacterized membrane protein
MTSPHSNTNAIIITSELIFTLVLFSLAFYTFSQSLVSSLILGLLGMLLPIAWPMELFFMLLLLVIIIDFIRKRGRSKRPWGMDIAWILFLPSVLAYALLDPFRIIGAPFSLSQLQPKVPFLAVLATAILLAASDIYFSGVESLFDVRARLAARGASKLDLDMAIWKNYLLIVGIVAATYVAALAGGAAIAFLEHPMAQLVVVLPYQSILLVVFIVSVIAIIIYVYLMRIGLSERKNREKSEDDRKR